MKYLALVACFLALTTGAHAQNVAISALPPASTPLTGAEIVPLVQSSITRRATTANIAAYTSANLGTAAGSTLALGGASIGSNALAVTGSAGVSGDVGAGSTSAFFWNGRATLKSPFDGAIQVFNNAQTQSFTITAGASNAAGFNGLVSALTGFFLPSGQLLQFDFGGSNNYNIGKSGTSVALNSVGSYILNSGSNNFTVTAHGGGAVDFGGGIYVPSANFYAFTSRAQISSPADGKLAIANAGATRSFNLDFSGIPVVTGTGSPTIAGGSTDAAGEVTSGTTATSVIITFSSAKTNAPFCTVTPQTQLVAFAYTISTTAITITQTATTAEKIDYFCVQH